MKKKYIAPKIQVRLVKIEPFILSTSNYRKTMIISKEKIITNADEILTKERPFYDEDDAFGIGEW